MSDQIHKNIRRSYQNSVQSTILETTRITEEVYKSIFSPFWEPAEIISRAGDRLRSSSLDLSSQSAETKLENVIREIEQETGVNMNTIQRSISLLIESLDEKVEQLHSLEDELIQSETMIREYDTRINRFADDINVIKEYITEPLQDHTPFLTSLRDSFVSELVRRNISEKLSEHERLVLQIRTMRPILKTLVVRNVGTSTMPICRICMDTPVQYAVDPCGHCYCEQCASRASSENRCYQCRRNIQKLIKLFA